MAMRKHRPITPSSRFRVTPTFEGLSKKEPEKSLLKPKNRISGRNCYGRITVRRRGGGHRRKYRVIDFRRNQLGIKGRVQGIEYDPNRTANIALVALESGEKVYMIHPAGLKVGDTVESGSKAEISTGNCLPLSDIPLGELIHNIELRPGAGGILVRSAGTAAQLMAKSGKYAQVRLPSGEQRKVLLTCKATVGVVGNSEHGNRSHGKAGASRWLGKRPKVRGVAMNPVDHPHGGGEGKTSGGRHPVSPWGMPTKGYKTRKNKATDKFIVRRRARRK